MKLREALAINHLGEIVPLKPKAMIRVCRFCLNEVHERWAGDEGLTVCDECETVEGPTKEITEEEYEEIHS